jgi:purine nucleosidase/non-specific riboncleoside hydrolase
LTTRTLIFDTDGGVDDAQALLLLIANGRTPDVITTVFGNVGLEAATANMLATLAVAGVSVPVHKGADRPLTQPIIDARHVHGDDGLGGAVRPARTDAPASSDAIGLLCRMFRDAARKGEKVDILMIGPLTNLALALRLEPAIIEGIGTLTIMGGTVYGRGNTTPAAEFNIYADPEAAQIVFSAAIETVIVPWEPCMAHRISGPEVDALFAAAPASPAREFQQALAGHARGGIVSRGHPDVMFFIDPLAAAVVIDPTIVRKSVTACVQVALSPGITRGMTVVDPSGRLGSPMLTLVEEVDAQKLAALYAVSTAYAPKQAYELS